METIKFYSPDNILPDEMTQCLVLYSNDEVHEAIYLGNRAFKVPDFVVVPAHVYVKGWQYMPNGEMEGEE